MLLEQETFTIEASRLSPTQVIGIDISNNMLEVGREKMKKISRKSNRYAIWRLRKFKFKDNTFDAVTAGFGVKKFEKLG